MQPKQLIAFASFLFCVNLCFGQGNLDRKDFQIRLTSDSTFYVLKVDDKVLEFDPSKEERINLHQIDPASIKMISVLHRFEAEREFGRKGRNGAVIIIFKDATLLTKELFSRFTVPE